MDSNTISGNAKAATAGSEMEVGPAETTAANAATTNAGPKEKPNGAPRSTANEKPIDSTSIQQLWSSAKSHGHSEIWGVQLADPETHLPSQVVLQKYLNANDGDVTKAREQLIKTLDWRKENKPLDLLQKGYDSHKFDGLGYVTSYGTSDTTDPESKEVFTWNIYGIVKDMDSTFGNLKDFMEWRIALMELALQSLTISSATTPITADFDPYKVYQVHDYKSVSFFRQSTKVKSASTEVIKTFAQNYPELLKEKFFVNVPVIMGAMYAFMKLFVAKKTAKKFHPMSNGGVLAQEFGDSRVKGLGEMLPKEYGGKGEDLSVKGTTPKTDAV